MIILNVEALRIFVRKKDWTLTDLARKMNFSYNMLQKVLGGQRNPSSRFIAGLLETCEGAKFEDFFIVTDECSADMKEGGQAV